MTIARTTTEWNEIQSKIECGSATMETNDVCYRREICHWQFALNSHLTNLQKLSQTSMKAELGDRRRKEERKKERNRAFVGLL